MQLVAPNPEVRVAMPYEYRPKPLLTSTEARFHRCLLSLTENRVLIQCKPRLADIFDHQGDIAAFNKISQKHVDFLICRPNDWTPMLGIELDDDSHERKAVKQRDMFVNDLFASARVPLLRIHVREADKIDALVEKLSHAWRHRWKVLEA